MSDNITTINDLYNQITIDSNCSKFSIWLPLFLKIYKKPFVDDNTYRFTYYYPTKCHLIPYFGPADMNSIRPIQIQQFFHINSYLSQSELNKLHMILVTAYRTAIDNGICKRSPMSYINYKSNRKKNEKHVYSDEQIKTVEQYSLEKFPEIVFSLQTGIRRGELCGFKKADINLQSKSFSINRSIAEVHGGGIKVMSPKWNSYREIPLSHLAIQVLKLNDNDSPFVFPNKFGNAQSPSGYSNKLQRFMSKIERDCNCPQLTAHELRHTFGTMLRRHGVDIYTIQKIMGHKDINVTANTYVHNELETLRSALQNSSLDY